MAKLLKARVVRGRYLGQTVRISNMGQDESGRQRAACLLADGTRANIAADDLEVIPEEAPPATPAGPRASMPFVSGSLGSRTMNQARSIAKPRSSAAPGQEDSAHLKRCPRCGAEFDERETGCPECGEGENGAGERARPGNG